jgi:hypothetical protein
MKFICTRVKQCQNTKCSHRVPHGWNRAKSKCEISCLGEARGVCRPIAERRKTVRAKRPVQQPQYKICPRCKGNKVVALGAHEDEDYTTCPRCKGAGKLRTVR